MRIVMIWREGADYSRTVEDWTREFERRTGYKVETVDPDKDEAFCQTYGIVEYPTIMAITENGNAVASWRGEMMPTFDEVGYWAGR